MGLRQLKGALNKLQKAKEKQRKAELKAKTAYDWLLIFQAEYFKSYDFPADFMLSSDHVEMNKRALDFAIISQSNNTRLMNPVARKELKSLLKDLEKKLND